jgi:putative DNA primase/helicase
MSIEARFLDFMASVDLNPVKFYPVADGRIHRFRIDGDKAGSLNGWCLLATDPIPHGLVGSWRTGESHKYRDQEARPINRAERAKLHRQMQQAKAERYQEQVKVWAEAATKANRLWGIARPASPDHGYLVAKGVKALGIRQLNESLVIPARDTAGQVHTLQFIGPDGGKRFLTGGQVQGHYYAIGRPIDTLCICEGYATAASVYEATGYATAVAFNAGNLVAVTRRLFAKFMKLRIVVVADDDYDTPGNPGLTEATRAAYMVGGWIARPDLTMMEKA